MDSFLVGEGAGVSGSVEALPFFGALEYPCSGLLQRKPVLQFPNGRLRGAIRAGLTKQGHKA